MKGKKEAADPRYLEAWRRACEIIVQGVCSRHPDAQTTLDGETLLPYGNRHLNVSLGRKDATVVCYQANKEDTTKPSFGLWLSFSNAKGESFYLNGEPVGPFDQHFDDLLETPEETLMKLLDFFSTP